MTAARPAFGSWISATSTVRFGPSRLCGSSERNRGGLRTELRGTGCFARRSSPAGGRARQDCVRKQRRRTDEPQSFRDRRSRTGRHPVLHPPAGGRRRLRLRHARAGGGPVLHHQDPDGHDGMAGRDGARDAGPGRRTAGEAASGADLVRPGGDDHAARLRVS